MTESFLRADQIKFWLVRLFCLDRLSCGMRMRNALVLFLLFAAPIAGFAAGPDESLRPYGVGVNGGAGIYLGNGLVLSVAHVVGGGIISRPTVTIAGQRRTATVLKVSPFEELDLALLEIDESGVPVSLRLRRIALCGGKPRPGEEVVSLAAQGPVRSRVVSATGLTADTKRFSTLIRDVASTGNSGSGLFDPRRKCLLGILSRKLSQLRVNKDTGEKSSHDVAKFFVPAAVIGDFIPAKLGLTPETHPLIQFSFGQ